MKRKFLYIVIILSSRVYAQEESNVRTYTPSVLLDEKQVDIQFFNNIYTQVGYYDTKGKFTNSGMRQSWYNGFIQAIYGIDKGRRVNIGFDLNIRSVLLDTTFSSPFNVLKFQNHNMARSEVITALGPKLKFLPFKNSRLSIQSAFWVPIQKNMEANPWLDYQRFTSWTQIFYDRTYKGKYQMFYEFDLMTRIGTDLNKNTFETRIPMSLFASYFASPKSTVYVMTQFVPFVSDFPTFYLQIGAGTKYQLTKSLNVELLYSNFIAGINQGAGQTFNLGLRYIK